MQWVEGARKFSLRKQLTFGDTTSGFPNKWHLRNERRNSILMMRHYPDLGSASDWLNQISHAARPIRSTTQIWVVTRHQYGISALVSQTSFGGETRGSAAKCRLFSRAIESSFGFLLVLFPMKVARGHSPGGFSRFQVTGMIEGFWGVWNFRFRDFFG